MYRVQFSKHRERMPHRKKKHVKKYWKKGLVHVDFAFQPIVNIHTGVCYGYEALLRNYGELGFRSVRALLDRAYTDGVLHHIELSLFEKAIEKYSRASLTPPIPLFFNIDSRLLMIASSLPDEYAEILDRYGLSHELVCLEMTSRQEQFCPETIEMLKRYRGKGVNIGIDNLGTGVSEMQFFYHFPLDFVKIDRFFIQDVASDSKKKLLVSNIVNLAHVLGTLVIAVGIESKEEFYVCRDMGFDYVQGRFIQVPEQDVSKFKSRYECIQQSVEDDRRQSLSDQKLIRGKIERLPIIPDTADICDVFDIFRKHSQNPLFPVISQNGEPVGVIHENDLKQYTYHQYGRDLLKNPSSHKTLKDFLKSMPISDIHTSVEKILEIFSINGHLDGILIVDNMQYVGLLTAQSLLKVLNEKNLAIAREQNPLTKLPGNMIIHKYVSNALDRMHDTYSFVYFDFDYFKPFNDTYGFRLGDRVILLFANLLKVLANQPHCFAGHIGGDDFFMGIENVSLQTVYLMIRELTEQFKREAESFYDPESIRRGFIVSQDREGKKKHFPLLSVSAVILELPAFRQVFTADQLSTCLATLKKRAKRTEDGICMANVLDM